MQIQSTNYSNDVNDVTKLCRRKIVGSKISRSKWIPLNFARVRRPTLEIRPYHSWKPLKRDPGLFPGEIMELTPDRAQILMSAVPLPVTLE